MLMECLLLEVKTMNSQLLRVLQYLDLMVLARKKKEDAHTRKAGVSLTPRKVMIQAPLDSAIGRSL